MTKLKRAAERRDDALSRERIVDEAIVVLDAKGEEGLTFRALASRLETGAGALYWHVTSKSELMAAASNAVVMRALADLDGHAKPRKTIRKIALGVFEAIDAHPWVGAHLSRGPWATSTLRIFEHVGRQLQALDVPIAAQFTAASALVSYILGVSEQNASNGRDQAPIANRREFLEREAARWKHFDAAEYPFIRSIADQLSKHDDRAEFLAGIDLILDGITTSLKAKRKRAT